ncbi:hypothetical protein BDV27DRAFT_148681 [Aspergillus caelatus]|uniref:FAD-binding PCMH-type domain-containing protein n=1 Tax=Aspergillus caelatus TaxID=61420 RepID=A0A5N6ZS24_9EURO|nr:uncharacterized protein BDV27DRAFT_148681 [Aspergillus caelatus]KAE8360427.1 hypothetical protein BDV27DRAFT_148681 [Aspergillus caelatus]
MSCNYGGVVISLAVVGGRFPTVGVSGLLLGGGLSFRHGVDGIGAMGVFNYEVVLANAEIVENNDLFWDLKGCGGGGCNFGIVTKVEMTTVPAKIWSEAKAIEHDNKPSLILACNDQGSILVSVYCDPVNKLPSVFEPFENIPFTSQSLSRGVHSTYELLEAMEGFSVPERDLRLTNVIRQISSISIKQSQKAGGNPLGLEEVGQQWFLMMTSNWNNPADGDRVRQAMRHIVDAAETTAKANGMYLPFQYCNYGLRGSGFISKLWD